MTADSRLLNGGDGAIILSANKHDISDNRSCGINSLIACCASSKDAMLELYSAFKKGVFAVAFSITGDFHLAEDCVAETFVRLTKHEGFNPAKGDGKGYIYATARNVALEYRRRYKRECISMVIQGYGEADKTVEDSIFLNQLMKHLNDKQRQIVVLKICNEMTFREIAKIMRSPESTVKSRYSKAMKILKEKAGVQS